jgi:hypothetical protein
MLVSVDEPHQWIVATEVQTSKVRWKDSGESPERTAPGEIIQYRVELHRTGNNWSLKEMTRV